jgi:conjugative transfer signal peptidase TraF
LLAASAASLAALLFPVVHHPHLRLVWNASASVPIGLYRIEPDVPPRVGDMVAVRPSPALTRFMAERRYVEAGVVLVKPVTATAGATVCRTGLTVTLDGHGVARALANDRFGRPLPRWSGCLRLRPDQIFLIAPQTSASFDSRYFGAVDRAQIVGRATPLWTWS